MMDKNILRTQTNNDILGSACDISGGIRRHNLSSNRVFNLFRCVHVSDLSFFGEILEDLLLFRLHCSSALIGIFIIDN
jgi:hypothetical protein